MTASSGPALPARRFARARLWVGVALLGSVLAGALLDWRFGISAKIRREGVAKLAGVAYDRLRKEGMVATLRAVMAHVEAAPLSLSIQYSLADPVGRAGVESADERNRLPEYKVIAGADPSSLAPSRDPQRPFDTWQRSHGNDFSNKFSSHAQINTANVARLEVAWVHRSGVDLGDASKVGTTVQTNPVIAGGRLFVGGERFLISVDAATGREAWRLELPGPVARRGLVWEPAEDFARSRLFVPTGRGIYAVGAADGRILSEFGDKGQVGGELSLISPAIVNDKLIIAIARPALEAYDLKTGRFLWARPLIDKQANPGSQLYGGVPWAGMSSDPVRGTVFVATGNARPQMVGVSRPGDNRHTCSVVAVDATTGDIKWSFQEVAHELWDLDVPSPPVLTTIKRGGKRVDVVATVTKIGNTLLLDRDTGRPIFDYRLKRAPVSSIPGERTAAYQPAVELPEPFSRLVFEPSEVTDLSASARETVLRKLRGARMGFFEPPVLGGKVVTFGLQGGGEWPGAAVDPRSGILYVPSNHLPWFVRAHYLDTQSSKESVAKFAGNDLYQSACAGCHQPTGEGAYETEHKGDAHFPALNGITFLRERGTLVSKDEFDRQHEAVKLPRAVTGADLAALYDYLSAIDRAADQARAFVMTGFWQVLLDDQGRPGSKPPWGHITAIDLNTGRRVWQVPFGQYENLVRNGAPVRGQRNHGGVIVTAGGLIFATGTVDNRVRALDAADGRELWSYKLPAAGSTPPSTYVLNGVQYVVVVAGGGQHVEFTGRSDQIIAFKLPRTTR